MPSFDLQGLPIYYEQYGSRADPPLLLVHGWTCQLIHWPKSFVDGLTASGLRVIALDNRDIGLSGKVSRGAEGGADSLASLLDDPGAFTPPYRLDDMARDVVALLDHLGQAGAHIVGFSMGGMIAQRLAIHHPERVFSLTSCASSTGNPELPRASEAAAAAFMRDPPSRASASGEASHRAAVIAFVRHGWNVIGGPHYRSTEQGLGRFAEHAYDRAFSPDGHVRQAQAIFGDGSRVDALAEVRAPTLVFHGGVDPLLPPAAGEDTARAIAGAELVVFPKMGHDLPEPLVPEIVERIARHALATRRR